MGKECSGGKNVLSQPHHHDTLARCAVCSGSGRKAKSEDLGWAAGGRWPAWLFSSLLARKNALIDHRSLLPPPRRAGVSETASSVLPSFILSTLSIPSFRPSFLPQSCPAPAFAPPRELLGGVATATEAESALSRSLPPRRAAWKTSRTNLIFQST